MIRWYLNRSHNKRNAFSGKSQVPKDSLFNFFSIPFCYMGWGNSWVTLITYRSGGTAPKRGRYPNSPDLETQKVNPYWNHVVRGKNFRRLN